MKFPTFKQQYKMDCGPSALKILLLYYNVNLSIHSITQLFTDRSNGTSLLQIAQAATKIGFKATGLNVTFSALRALKRPCLIHWNQQHFVVVAKITDSHVTVSDPGPGILIKYTHSEFLKHWISKNDGDEMGYILDCRPTIKIKDINNSEKRKHFKFILDKYIRPYKEYYSLIAVGMFIGLAFSIITPFLTKAIVDIGIQKKDISFINLILLAQLVTAISSTTLNTVRSWIFLHMGVRMNVSVVSDFLSKIMRLPISFFDSSQVGDLMQRIADHSTVRSFLSAGTFNMLFSFFNLIVFGGILAYFNLKIFIVFLIFSIIYTIWVLQFMSRRKAYDYKLFETNTSSQNYLLQILGGIKDIKLAGLQAEKRKEWIDIQIDSFKVNKQQMQLGQFQQVGSFLIDLLKSIFISYLTAKAVIQNEMTLGMMLSVQYILGQLNVPVTQFVGFSNSLQDAKIGIERISDVYDRNDEQVEDNLIKASPKSDIMLNGLNFHYISNRRATVLKNIKLTIPYGKFTAIVGSSGSGKSTILKLLLKFYDVSSNSILIGNKDLNILDTQKWRNECGAVMQDGFIFTDSIVKNIALNTEDTDWEQIVESAKTANIHEHIMSLPDGYETKIGTEINSFSQGQRQRLLIARAVYKNPDYLFLDEPTTALDSNNEKLIMENILNQFSGKTIVMIAHRLSTIKSADQIIVMDKGEIIELGSHESLLQNKSLYHELIKNQS